MEMMVFHIPSNSEENYLLINTTQPTVDRNREWHEAEVNNIKEAEEEEPVAVVEEDHKVEAGDVEEKVEEEGVDAVVVMMHRSPKRRYPT